MAKTISAKLDEEEKKIIDLIRQHKLDYVDVKWLFKLGARASINSLNVCDIENSPALQRDLYKYTKLLEALEKGE